MKYIILTLTFLLSLSLSSSSYGQNFAITTSYDAVDANIGNGICDDGTGNCTLRAAIQESNAIGGDHTITLTTGTFKLSIAGINEDASATGDLDVTANITINGVSPASTIVTADSLDRVFHVLPGASLTCKTLTVTKGYASESFGGGILNEGILILKYTHITDNLAQLKEGTQIAGGFGGGIANVGQLSINNSTLFLNRAIGGRGINGENGGGGSGSTPGIGGGIYNNGVGTINIINSTIANNDARGGKYSGGSPNNGYSNIAGKQGAGPNGGAGGASSGGTGASGGEYSGGGGGGSSTLFGGIGGLGGYGGGGGGRGAKSEEGSSGVGGLGGFGGGQGSGPCCSSGGGGGAGAGLGGGIFNDGGTITTTNVTIAYNNAYGGQGETLTASGGYAKGGTDGAGFGGGIFNRAGVIDINNTLVTNNYNHNDLDNSMLSVVTTDEDLWGNYTSTDGHNLIFNVGNGILAGTVTGNIVGQDPKTYPLANYGGLTYTIAINKCQNSPAIDAALDIIATTLDQRDFPRVHIYSGASTVDIGAFEAPDTLDSFMTTDVQACVSYTWIDGINYTENNNTAVHTIIGGASNGCDSIVTLNLTINNPGNSTDLQSACASFTWMDGITYTSSNHSATHIIAGGAANGCDSIVTLNLTITAVANSIDTQSACAALTWIDGNNYTSSNHSATHIITGGAANGCDSIVTLNLTITGMINSIDTQSACAALTWIDGNNYTSANHSATHTITGGAANGCDSMVTLNLTIFPVLTISLGEDLFICDEAVLLSPGGNFNSYLWSNNSNASTLVAKVPGVYSVTVTDINNCSRSDHIELIENCRFSFWVPNVFTPNGDHQNDIFNAVLENSKSFHMEIFNRWGTSLFQTNSTKLGWDGKDAATGTYFYIISYSYTEKGELINKTVKGTVSLLK